MERAYGRERRDGVMWRGSLVSLAVWHQVMFQFLYLTFAPSCLGVIKTCVNNRGMERQKVRGEKRKVRRVREEGCLCESFFFFKDSKREREAEWKKYRKVWKSSSFSPLAEEHMWRAGVSASCGRKRRHSKSIGNCSLYRSFWSTAAQCWGQGIGQDMSRQETFQSRDW